MKKKRQFSSLLPYIFAKGYSKNCFKEKTFRNQYNILFLHEFNSNIKDMRDLFASITLKEYEHLSFILIKMLQIEQYHNSQFIVIKKLVISYRELQGIPKDAEMKQQTDLFCNIILIRNRTRIKLFCVVRKSIKDRQFLCMLRQLVQKIQKKNPFIVILNEYELGTQLSWQQYYKFYVHIKKEYNSRLYVTNMHRYSQLNGLMLSHVKIKLFLQRSLITEDNFYEVVEEKALKTIISLANIESSKP